MSLDNKADEGGNDSLSTLSDFPFFVIRHSERVDEVNPTEWEELVQRTFGSDATDGLPVLAHSGKRPMPGTLPIRSPSSRAGSFSVAASSSSTTSPRGTSAPLPKRNKTAFIQDPPLSNTNGQVYAEQAAETIGSTLLPSILSSLSSASPSVPIRIYSSRFLRAIQTAMPLALKLHLPIHISFGLSTVLPQVAKAKDLNQFLSVDDLHVQFPSVSFISCDDLSHTETYLPTSGWIDSVHSIVQRSKERNELAIIVGHRETVRGLAGRYLTTPYCTIAMFDRKRLDIVVADNLVNKKEERDDSKHEANLKEAEESQAPLSMKNLKSAVTSSSLGVKAVRPNVKVVAKTSLEPKKKSSRQREGPIYELLKLYDCRGNILNISDES
jgi:broad specificity phosphatase PhoE